MNKGLRRRRYISSRPISSYLKQTAPIAQKNVLTAIWTMGTRAGAKWFSAWKCKKRSRSRGSVKMTPPRLRTTTTKQPSKPRLVSCEDLIRFYEHPSWARSPIPSAAHSFITSKASLLPEREVRQVLMAGEGWMSERACKALRRVWRLKWNIRDCGCLNHTYLTLINNT